LVSRWHLQNLPKTPFKLFALQQHATVAARALQPNIGASARHRPFAAAAGVWLSQPHAHPNNNRNSLGHQKTPSRDVLPAAETLYPMRPRFAGRIVLLIIVNSFCFCERLRPR
jgi:hypothetical protein